MGKRLGTYIQQLRKQRGGSIRQVGHRVGLSPSYLSHIEAGRREASVSVLYRLVQHLEGDFTRALRLLATDAGVPEEALHGESSQPDHHSPATSANHAATP